MTEITGEEVLKAVEQMEFEKDGSKMVHPAVLANRNVNIEDIEDVRECYFNTHWSEKIKQHLSEGFVIMRIQTEYQGDDSGHATKVYMVKLKNS